MCKAKLRAKLVCKEEVVEVVGLKAKFQKFQRAGHKAKFGAKPVCKEEVVEVVGLKAKFQSSKEQDLRPSSVPNASVKRGRRVV